MCLVTLVEEVVQLRGRPRFWPERYRVYTTDETDRDHTQREYIQRRGDTGAEHGTESER